MTEDQKLLREVVARALETWASDGFFRQADAAIAVALEEAAKLAETKADEWGTVWRNRFKADNYMWGMFYGADDIAAAIRALIPKEKG